MKDDVDISIVLNNIVYDNRKIVNNVKKFKDIIMDQIDVYEDIHNQIMKVDDYIFILSNNQDYDFTT